MSQTYVIKVSASVREHVSSKDKRTKKIILTKIVAEDEQKQIMRDLLEERGWEEEEGSEGQVWSRENGGTTETINLETMEVEAEVELEKVIEREKKKTVRGDTDYGSREVRRKKEQEKLESELEITENEKDQVELDMAKEIATTLDETEEKRTKDLNELVRDVYKESLKRKAGRMGSVQEIREGQDGQDYEMVIKITE